MNEPQTNDASRERIIPLSEIETNPDNPRKIEGEQMQLLINSILVFPKMLMARRIVIAHGTVAQGGNMRTMALNMIATMSIKDIEQHLASCPDYNRMDKEQQKELLNFWKNWKKNPVAPIYDGNHFTEEELRQFIIKDNANFGSWDWDALANNWDEADLKAWGVDCWQPSEESTEEKETDDSAEDNYDPAAPVETRCKAGDIWRLGDHLLLCGDSTKPAEIRKLMRDEQADLWLTDPPYNVAYEGGTGLTIQNDNMGGAKFHAFLKDAFAAAKDVMTDGCPFYVWFATREHLNFEGALNDVGLKVRQELIWNKNALVLGRSHYQWKHEPCLYGWKGNSCRYFIDVRNETTVIPDAAELDFDTMKKDQMKELLETIYAANLPTTVIDEDKPAKSEDHPTMKPVKLFGRLIFNSSKRGDIVLDTFGGSGTTIVACEQMGRKARVVELDPHYCDVIITRWEKLTGKEALRLAQ